MNYVILIIFAIIGLVLSIIWKELVSPFMPSMFQRLEFLNYDSSIKRILILKSKNGQYKYNGNDYFLQDENPYFEKGIRKFFFKEGERYPVNFRLVKVERNIDHETKFFEKNISDMLMSKKDGLTDFFKEYGNIIIIVGLAIVGLMIYKNQNVPVP